MEVSPGDGADLFVTVPPLAAGWHVLTVTTPWGSSDPLGFDVGTVPGQPGTPVATAGDSRVQVSWSAATDDGGSPITGYEVTALPGGEACATAGVLTCTVTGLADFQAYTFMVAAVNKFGAGSASDESNVVVPGPPAYWFHPLTPTRLIDSCPATQVGPDAGPWHSGQTRTVSVAGAAGVPGRRPRWCST